MSRLLPTLAALAIAACTALPEEPRVINVAASISPAAATLNGTVDGLLRKTGPSYVTLVVLNQQPKDQAAREEMPKAVTSGSGFVVDPTGYVLTAAHVAVQQGWMVEARGPDGRAYNGKVVDVLREQDMALVKLTGLNGAEPVVPTDTPCLRRGDAVLTLGKPRSIGDTARLGEVSAMSFGHPVAYQGYGYPDAMVLRVQSRKGESGGPVFNGEGELAGMVVSTLSDPGGEPLDLAHAVTAPMLARYLCGRLACSPRWRALTTLDTRSCRA